MVLVWKRDIHVCWFMASDRVSERFRKWDRLISKAVNNSRLSDNRPLKFRF